MVHLILGTRIAATALFGLLLLLPAAAQTVVDGSDRAVPKDHLKTLLSIVAAQGGPGVELRALRRAKSAGSIIYCGSMRLRGATKFVPLLVNVTAGIAYALTDNLAGREREYRRARLGLYGCL